MTERERIVVVCGTDNRYTAPLAVTLRSAIDHLDPQRSILAYVLYSDVTDEDRRRVSHDLPSNRCAVRWIPVDASKVAGVPLWGRMPVSTYFKLFLTELLPADITRAVWLDCDLLVLDDLSVLWDTDLRGFAAAAVQDKLVPRASSRGGIARRAEVGISDDAKYFNAGVMLIDLPRWRAERVTARALDHLTRRWKSVVFWDQEGLNVALTGRWLELDAKWNYNVSLPSNRRRADEPVPGILHFAGMLKPWVYRTSDPEWSRYIECLDTTSWKGTRPRRTAVALGISLYERSGLRRLFHPLENLAMRVVREISRAPTQGPRVGFASRMRVGNQ